MPTIFAYKRRSAGKQDGGKRHGQKKISTYCTVVLHVGVFLHPLSMKYFFMYQGAILCIFQIAVDFYYVRVDGGRRRGRERGAGGGGGGERGRESILNEYS